MPWIGARQRGLFPVKRKPPNNQKLGKFPPSVRPTFPSFAPLGTLLRHLSRNFPPTDPKHGFRFVADGRVVTPSRFPRRG
jgi:hypothetical protein